MKITAMLFKGFRCEWKVRISPRGQDKSVSTRWKHNMGETLIFNPIVSLTLASKDGYINIPIQMTYMLEDTVSSVYSSLGEKGLYKKDGPRLYLDAKTADKLSRKISCYKSTLLIRPAVIDCGDEDATGIDFITDGKIIGSTRFDEIRAFCEVLSHLDVSTFTMIAMLADTLTDMDEKLDHIIETQAMILQLLDTQVPQQQKQQEKNPYLPSEFQWNMA